MKQTNTDIQEKYEALEPLLEALVNYCNNVGLCCLDEVIAAEAGLERLYRARKAAHTE